MVHTSKSKASASFSPIVLRTSEKLTWRGSVQAFAKRSSSQTAALQSGLLESFHPRQFCAYVVCRGSNPPARK